VADIIEQVPALVEPKPWELADALCQRDSLLVLRMQEAMRSSTPTAIFTNCVARLREVLAIIALQDRGINSPVQIASALGKQDWQIRSSLAAAKRFSKDELTEHIRLAHQTEAAMKSGADAEHILVLWLLDVCQYHR
jgi:DNA polymerase-3 subunit delta